MHYSIDTTQEIYLDRQVGLSRMEGTGSEMNDSNEMAAMSHRQDDFERSSAGCLLMRSHNYCELYMIRIYMLSSHWCAVDST